MGILLAFLPGLGAVIGAGLEIAAACDLRVAAEGTKFAMPEVRLGIPSVVEAALLPRLLGSGPMQKQLLQLWDEASLATSVAASIERFAQVHTSR